MRPQQSGSIVLTASVSGLTAWSHAAPYCATKAAVIQLAKVAAVEYARDGIRVNCVCPGTFLLGHPRRPARRRRSTRSPAKHPLGLGAADDLVGAYAYLAERRLPLDDRLGHGRRRRLLGALTRCRSVGEVGHDVAGEGLDLGAAGLGPAAHEVAAAGVTPLRRRACAPCRGRRATASWPA